MDSGCRLLAAKYIRRQVKQLAGQLDGVRAADDIEFVHRARVATRRLRAAMRVFVDCFPRKRLRRWQKAIRRTTAKLGDARDRDVQIELLCGILSSVTAKECFPAISRMLVQLERDRERLQRKVVKAVDRLEAKGLLADMRRATKRILRKSASADENAPVALACPRIGQHVFRQVNKLFQYQDSLGDSNNRNQHHAMRIAAKRLRYTLEIARPVYAGRLDEAVGAIKRLQSLLGDIHDCNVWIEHLDAFSAEERQRLTSLFGHAGRLARLQPGIEYLRRDRLGHRQEAFNQLVAYWSELAGRQFWKDLVGAVLNQGAEQPLADSQDVDRQPERPENDQVPSAEHKPLLTAGV